MEGCASRPVGLAFHLVWNIFGCYAMMQLFTGAPRVLVCWRIAACVVIALDYFLDLILFRLTAAVILENFIEVVSGDSQTIDEEKLNEFVEVWTKLDPHAGVLLAKPDVNDGDKMLLECFLRQAEVQRPLTIFLPCPFSI